MSGISCNPDLDEEMKTNHKPPKEAVFKLTGGSVRDNMYEILENLSLSDCLVFPYQTSNESSSASVRLGLATLKPTFVTPLEIFDDVSDLVNYLPGFSPSEIADAIFTFFDNSKNKSMSSDRHSSKTFQLIKSRRFSKVSKRLANIIKSLEINQD